MCAHPLPAGPLQLLKLLLNELIIHEMEMFIADKYAYQFIYERQQEQNNMAKLEQFLELLGADYLTRIRTDDSTCNTRADNILHVLKQEIFETNSSSYLQQVLILECAWIFSGTLYAILHICTLSLYLRNN